MKEVLQKNSPAVETGVQPNENDDQGKAACSLQSKEGDSEIVRKSEGKISVLPSRETKCWTIFTHSRAILL